MKISKSEIVEHPFPGAEKNIRVLETLSDATFGCDYSESFLFLKEIRCKTTKIFY